MDVQDEARPRHARIGPIYPHHRDRPPLAIHHGDLAVLLACCIALDGRSEELRRHRHPLGTLPCHYNTVVDMEHFKVPLMLNNVPLNTFRGTLKCASFTHATKSFWGTLVEVPLIKFNRALVLFLRFFNIRRIGSIKYFAFTLFFQAIVGLFCF
jgi:hypothetical protein